MRREEHIDVDDEKVRADLKNTHRDFFNSIFKWYMKWPHLITDYKYENKYRSIRVGASDQKEYAITCLVKDDQLGIKKYFVSERYNVNIVVNDRPIFGRFIFDGSKLLAMAEEPAVTWRHILSTEYQYVLSRLNSRLSKWIYSYQFYYPISQWSCIF